MGVDEKQNFFVLDGNEKILNSLYATLDDVIAVESGINNVSERLTGEELFMLALFVKHVALDRNGKKIFSSSPLNTTELSPVDNTRALSMLIALLKEENSEALSKMHLEERYALFQQLQNGIRKVDDTLYYTPWELLQLPKPSPSTNNLLAEIPLDSARSILSSRKLVESLFEEYAAHPLRGVTLMKHAATMHVAHQAIQARYTNLRNVFGNKLPPLYQDRRLQLAREIEIFMRYQKDLTYQQIAQELGLSEHAVIAITNDLQNRKIVLSYRELAEMKRQKVQSLRKEQLLGNKDIEEITGLGRGAVDHYLKGGPRLRRPRKPPEIVNFYIEIIQEYLTDPFKSWKPKEIQEELAKRGVKITRFDFGNYLYDARRRLSKPLVDKEE